MNKQNECWFLWYFTLWTFKASFRFCFHLCFFLELRNLQGKLKIYYSDKPKDLQRSTESMSLAFGSCPTLQSVLCSRYLGSKLLRIWYPFHWQLSPLIFHGFCEKVEMNVNSLHIFTWVKVWQITWVLFGVTLLFLYIMEKQNRDKPCSMMGWGSSSSPLS